MNMQGPRTALNQISTSLSLWVGFLHAVSGDESVIQMSIKAAHASTDRSIETIRGFYSVSIYPWTSLFKSETKGFRRYFEFAIVRS